MAPTVAVGAAVAHDRAISLGVADWKGSTGGRVTLRKRTAQLFFHLRAETSDTPERTRFDSSQQFIGAFHVQLIDEWPHALRTETRQMQHRDDPWGHAIAQLTESGKLARIDQSLDLACQLLADPGRLANLFG